MFAVRWLSCCCVNFTDVAGVCQFCSELHPFGDSQVGPLRPVTSRLFCCYVFWPCGLSRRMYTNCTVCTIMIGVAGNRCLQLPVHLALLTFHKSVEFIQSCYSTVLQEYWTYISKRDWFLQLAAICYFFRCYVFFLGNFWCSLLFYCYWKANSLLLWLIFYACWCCIISI